ncbi:MULTISPECIES: phage tail assembly chaperone [Lysinibacillus]|uniref:Uncharacterized protein n=2 Tax=Lysinibacillus TaxID=400634 RepID=B1HPC7_LYSSC|nr:MULTISPECIES: hypothetical protein [Lysinibacillus]ACA40573.1 hypothetical protein Bsph_3058 [Lysinibacillus sphaericus C3-41]MCS1396058.1 hypothetical protein [Lysinibacillus sp. PB211]MDR0159205.1 hypothetical protein [Lysinibacillus sphaericus]UZM97839.1 hypothetical protein OL548_23155 [Lysinibacillus sp. MHQ-1]
MGADQLLCKMLTIGEIAYVDTITQEANGYDAELEDIVEEVKKLIEDGDGECTKCVASRLNMCRYPWQIKPASLLHYE